MEIIKSNNQLWRKLDDLEIWQALPESRMEMLNGKIYLGAAGLSPAVLHELVDKDLNAKLINDKLFVKATFRVMFEQTATGLSSYVEHFPIYTTGKDIAEIKRNITEAINLYFESDCVTEKDIFLIAVLEYRECKGSVEYSVEDGVWFGQILGVTDLVLYEGDNLVQLRTSFMEAVDEYLSDNEELGEEPKSS